MESHGASQWQIGLSWGIFSLPYIFLIRGSGWMADHWDRRFMAIGGISISMTLFTLWPHIGSPNWMIGLNVLEAIAYALVMPSIQSLLTEGRRDKEMGRVQGIYATGSTAAITVSAVVAGFLYGMNPMIPFTAAVPFGVAAAITAAVLWRSTKGRVSPSVD